jgi:hypothetical protein
LCKICRTIYFCKSRYFCKSGCQRVRKEGRKMSCEKWRRKLNLTGPTHGKNIYISLKFNTMQKLDYICEKLLSLKFILVCTGGNWLVYVVNRLSWNLSITSNCMVDWLSKKLVLEKIVGGNQKIGIIRVICATFCPVIYWISLISLIFYLYLTQVRL